MSLGSRENTLFQLALVLVGGVGALIALLAALYTLGGVR